MTVRELSNRVFVPGDVTKGKVLSAFQKAYPNKFHVIKIMREQFMDSQYWEEGTINGIPGHFVTLHMSFDDEVQMHVVPNDERVSVSDRSKAIPLSKKK